jgi:signal transduction histidine kinase
MNPPQTPNRILTGSAASPEAGPHREEEARPARIVSRRWLTLARAAWAVVAIMAVVIFGVGLSAYYDQLRKVCTGSTCTDWQLTPENLQAIEDLGLSLGFYATYSVALAIVFAGVCFVLAAVIVWRAQDRMALFVAFALVLFGIVMPQAPQNVAVAHPILSWLSHSLAFLGFASIVLFINLFPGGRFMPRWTRWTALVWIIMAGQGVFFPDSLSNPWLSLLNTLGFMGAAGASLGALVYRYRRRADPIQRQQIKWVVFGIVAALGVALGIALLSIVFPEPRPSGLLSKLLFPSVFTLAFLLIPVSIAVAILRYRLWDVDFIINRTLVYGALTVCVVGVYILVVGYLGTLLRMGDNLFVSLVATGVVAILFAPLRNWLQRGVNRLMYGERDEPYAVVSRLGRRLEATLAPQDVLPTIVETVRDALKLPYAAITVKKGDEVTGIAASTGEPVEKPLRLPLLYRNEPVGELLLGPRIGEEDFSAADRRLLEDLARQAGVAAHAVRLTNDLQRSRERLVATREEERRRLRRDLHDGLGAQLAGLNVQTRVLRGLIRRDPEAADELVVELRDELRSAISDIRRLVYDLRPPALDDLGLMTALRRLAERYSAEAEGLRVQVETPEDLPPLPAAVEVAIYRIVQEALTNVVRHADAKTCIVRLAVEDRLMLEVMDDGAGISGDHVAGVGLLSMRERAEELGGGCNIEPVPEGGTRVLVRLPLSREE